MLSKNAQQAVFSTIQTPSAEGVWLAASQMQPHGALSESQQGGEMPFQIVRDDVTAISADAVVVPSNEQLLISGGVGGQVAAIAGREQLQAAASAAAPCPAGHAVAVSPGSYPARCIVFATGPQWPGNPQPSALHRVARASPCRSSPPVASPSPPGTPSHARLRQCASSSPTTLVQISR